MMTLYKGHAILPRAHHEAMHEVRTYLVLAESWQDAQKRIGSRELGAHFVTVPTAIPDPLLTEIPDPVLTETRSIDAREFADLRSACAWSEAMLRTRSE